MAKKASSLRTKAQPKPTKAPAPFPSTGFWLMKAEPEAYSIDDFAKDRETLWTGVRNYQARNFMMTSMRPGDRFLFYRSNANPTGVVGVGRILDINRSDPTALDKRDPGYDPKASRDHPIWFCAKVGYEGHVKSVVSLAEIRARKDLSKMVLVQKGSRLSVQPVMPSEFKLILEMAGGLEK